MKIRMTRSRLAGSLAAAFILMSVAQPTAYGLDFPSTTQLSFPESPAANLVASQEINPLDFVAVPLPELSQVAIIARQVEAARTPYGAKQVTKAIMEEEYGWKHIQFSCINKLWTKESHWNYKAHNSRSGAHGIAQALPASKMEVVSTDWRTNPVTQIRWGLRYIEDRYQNPCGAWAKFKRSRYY